MECEGPESRPDRRDMSVLRAGSARPKLPRAARDVEAASAGTSRNIAPSRGTHRVAGHDDDDEHYIYAIAL